MLIIPSYINLANCNFYEVVNKTLKYLHQPKLAMYTLSLDQMLEAANAVKSWELSRTDYGGLPYARGPWSLTVYSGSQSPNRTVSVAHVQMHGQDEYDKHWMTVEEEGRMIGNTEVHDLHEENPLKDFYNKIEAAITKT